MPPFGAILQQALIAAALLLVASVALSDRGTQPAMVSSTPADAATALPPGTTILQLELGAATPAWSPDGTLLAVSAYGGARSYPRFSVQLWDAQTGLPVRGLADTRGAGISGSSLSFTRDGRQLVAPLTDSAEAFQHTAMIVWDAASGAVLRQIPGPLPDRAIGFNEGQSLALSPDGRILALAADPNDHVVAFYDPATWQLAGTLTVDAVLPSVLAFSPDGKVLAVAGRGNDIVLVDPHARRVRRVIAAFHDSTRKPPDYLGSLAFSPDGRFVVAAPGFFSALAPIDAASGTSGQAIGPLRIWRVEDGALYRSFGQRGDRFDRLAWSPRRDGALVTAGADDRTLRFWQVDDPGDDAVRIVPLPEPASGLAFSPDGTRLAVSSGTKVLILRMPE